MKVLYIEGLANHIGPESCIGVRKAADEALTGGRAGWVLSCEIQVGQYLRSVVLGHVRYYGVPMNGPAIGMFRLAVGRVWWLVLRRRSQGNHLPWRRMRPLIDTWLPPARICHPYPLVRLGVVTRGGSRMR